ncbi:ABC transporter permease [Paenibacillus thiaminolyticus]|uniref:Transport permease protein n=2 Tax=Paenibacillus thiaminolyticus TaxID=49283 RepID=A0ABT4FS41_PANTH|nr:ABC transporter permease [Paenibacillus thiaminolyticus]MCY9537767.1 ABC transporter permease [Paenibacillus thiaminolyticus]MCY9604044.1 ABC transporter permease [Paenibacillus thiaminolyticus]MCY9606911.1 ABC transporter permease [Paenibacillus thiaminolyticus]MCY9616270.1 ABC transporter permease [Paenibacillus thiaminolyticus]MCY9619357.1 ABC transporter permease [Paenibacillus thiaminolyticus]
MMEDDTINIAKGDKMNQYLSNLFKYKDLFFELVRKDIKLKYRNSVLGILWSMLNPLLMMVVLSIVFATLFKNEIPHFAVYVLIGRIVYQFFSEATNFAMDSIYANGQLIKKVYVPKYFFPLSRVCSSFITTFVALVPLGAVMIVTGLSFRWINLMFLFPMLYLLIISAGIGLILASINVFFKDMKHFYSIILMVVMYMTPIFYPASIIPEKYMPLIMINPLFTIVNMFRDVMMNGVAPDLMSHLLCIAYMLIYGVLGLFVFYKSQDRFIYHL